MEAISTSINVTKIHPKSKTHHFHHLKQPSHLLLHHPHISTSTTKTPTSISTKPTPPSHHHYTPTQLQPIPSRIHTHTHRNAATGYAAALIDAALCNNSLDAIHKDVKRLLKWLHHNETLKDMMADPFVEEGVKGRVIKEVTEKARFQRQVAAMVKMLVAKSKSGMVAQVMEEFERIYHELNGG
ncbi:hypothetical protein L1987_76960 [Smallanthus sonchifolius]|uniref:Uncharacterized protein n=1 Tax=Smallanthus sonchifolius TaxID=185202 RepID=A0ACB8Z8U8_9ASTR|nr:hypothetical protein L1987_76960 [Smallanthus sonchifolius]